MKDYMSSKQRLTFAQNKPIYNLLSALANIIAIIVGLYVLIKY